MPPDDPLGRHGPSLDNFLRKKPLPSEHRKQPCPYGKIQLCPCSPHLCPSTHLSLPAPQLLTWDHHPGNTQPQVPMPPCLSFPAHHPSSFLLQGRNVPMGSSADSSIQRGQAAPSALWLTSSEPMPSFHPPGPQARTKVSSDLHLPLSLPLCPQRVSRAAWMERSWGLRHLHGPTRRA
jgi:hypothetical protein